MKSLTQSIIHVRRRWGRRNRGVGVARTSVTAFAATALLATTALVAPAPAGAAIVISNVRVEYATPSSFVVTLNSLGAGWRYRIYASTNRPQIYYDVMSRAPYKSSYAPQPRIGIGRIPYTTKPVWYRVQAEKGTARRTSDIFSVGLQPAKPTGVTATSVKGSISITWGGGAASGAQVQHATNSGFTAGVKTYTLTGTGRQLTAIKLRSGTPHWFRVRSRNLSTPSAFTAAIRATPSGRTQDLRVMSYNILTLSSDGGKAPGGTISPWSQRKPVMVRYINSVKPDLIGIQEGASWTGAVRGPRQVDDLLRSLGTSSYGLARTETPPNEPYYFRASSYILYKKATYAPVGAGGHWDIGKMPEGGSRYGAYQVMQHRASGAKVLFISTHLYTPGGATGDKLRQQETQTLISKAKAHAAKNGGVPIIYAGDYNSHELHPLDGPAVAMNSARVADTFWVSPIFANKQYNSANQYYRTPPAFSDNVDHIYASPGVAVRAWSQVLQLKSGKFVGAIPSDHNAVLADLTYGY